MIRSIIETLSDLRFLVLFPKRDEVPVGMGPDYWMAVLARYFNAEKRLDASECRWYVIGFADGRRELAYLRVRRDGLFCGSAPAIYRGLVFPRRVTFVTWAHVVSVRQAF